MSLGRWPVRRAVVRGSSMVPTLADGDVVLITRWGPVRPGAVVLVRWVQRPAQLSIKRAVRLEARGWHVLGDNPGGSTDSRLLGTADVLGVVRYRLWPAPGRVARSSA